MRVNKDLLVRLQYKLFQIEEGEDDQLIEETSAEQPLVYIHGLGVMIPGFEAALAGKGAGEHFDFTLQPEEAYGEYRDDLYITIPKSAFLVDGKFDQSIVYEGAMVPMMADDGQTVTGQVIVVSDNDVEMDFNHQLAGAVLRFQGEIEEVREPTEEEFQAFLSPLMGGGCSCGGSCGCDTCGPDERGNCGCGGGGCC